MASTVWPVSPADRRYELSCWSRRDLLVRGEAWMRALPSTVRRELMSAATEVHERPFDTWAQVGALRRVGLFASELKEELVLGSGVVFVAGLGHDDDQVLRWAYLILGVHLGQPLGANGSLVEISGRCHTSPQEALADTSPETRFHTDSFDGARPDVVGTLCLTPAVRGGEFQVASGALAHEIVRLRGGGEVLAQLYEPFLRDHATPGGQGRAVFAMVGRRLLFDYTRPGIESGYERAGQRLSERQREGLDLLDQALMAPVSRLQLQMRRGDVLFVNNWHVAHNRRPFMEDPTRRRRMVRMWLGCP